MKKIITVLFILAHSLLFSHAQVCTPDTTTSGISPDKLPDATVGQTDSVVVSLKVPKDTSIVYNGNAVPVNIDSAQILYINNFPNPSFKYNCNIASCTWIGGTRGCVKLFGTPSNKDSSKYDIKIFVVSFISVPGLPGQQFTRIDSNTLTLNIKAANLVSELNNTLQYKVYPNPANEKIYVYGLDINTQQSYSFNIFDVTGKTLKTFVPKAFGDVFELNIADIPKGIYLLKISNEDKQSSTKIVIE